MDNLKRLFSELVDIRDSRGKRHCLMHILIMSVCAILRGYNDFDDIADFAKANEEWFNEHLNLWNGVPVAATMRNVFRIIPSDKFLEIFLMWINEIVKDKTDQQIIIDGKAIRAATEKSKNENTPYIVSAYIADMGISIGQRKIDKKSNEITAIPKLLDLLEINGCIITIDAIDTQTKIMDKIKEKGGDFILPLKKNQKGAYQEVQEYFTDSIDDKTLIELTQSKKHEEIIEFKNNYQENFNMYITRETGHGRKEERIYIKSTNVDWFVDEKFKHIKCIIMVIRNSSEHNTTINYYISSVDLPVEELAQIIRKHWQIENNLHWVLDMYFYEDLSRNRKDNALENLSLVRKICYNIIKLDKRYKKLSIKRRTKTQFYNQVISKTVLKYKFIR